jgi:hypothetical protein
LGSDRLGLRAGVRRCHLRQAAGCHNRRRVVQRSGIGLGRWSSRYAGKRAVRKGGYSIPMPRSSSRS